MATRRLQNFPEIGRVIPEVADTSLREIIVQGYRVIYRLEEQCVLILAVMHGRRDVDHQQLESWDYD